MHQSNQSFGGYIRKRLAEKCIVNGIELVAISSKDTRNICSRCGALGTCDREGFNCKACGYSVSVALNSAKNIENKANGTVKK